ncbi:MAG TPA: hypothetical protein PLC35_04505 [Methanosarcina vacuolata]|nr:hypothetical protein [Methanosarcina vacuolata]
MSFPGTSGYIVENATLSYEISYMDITQFFRNQAKGTKHPLGEIAARNLIL